jgi:Glycosyl transferases group 1
MVVLEGMLHALPIIASDTGGPAEILRHRRTGLLFPPQDVEQLTAYIIELAQNPDLRANLGRAAAREVRRAWSWPRMVAAMREVYAQLVAPDGVTRVASVSTPGRGFNRLILACSARVTPGRSPAPPSLTERSA